MLFHPLLLKKGYDNSCHRCACGTVYEKLSIAVCNCLEQGTLGAQLPLRLFLDHILSMNKGSSLYKVVGCLLGIDYPDEFGSEANGLSEAELVSIVSSSCLVPVLESVLSGASFTDMSSRCTPSLHPECIMHAILVH
jgi:hypothetical protein